jgi:hypothetical protein
MHTRSGQFCNVSFGCDAAPFNTVRVRQALAMCVDRKAMVDFVAEALARLVTIRQSTRLIPTSSSSPPRFLIWLARSGCSPMPAIVRVSRQTSSPRIGRVRTQLAVALREMTKPAGFDQRADHAARNVSQSGVEEGKFLYRLLQYATNHRRDFFLALYVECDLERDRLEQSGV